MKEPNNEVDKNAAAVVRTNSRWFSGIFRGYKMATLGQIGLNWLKTEIKKIEENLNQNVKDCLN